MRDRFARRNHCAGGPEGGPCSTPPDCYMEKIVVVFLARTRWNSTLSSRSTSRTLPVACIAEVEDLVVMVLDRPRHEKLIADIRKAGARIKLIGDGDLSAGIAAAVIGTGVHVVMVSGGAPEGVITAAAIRCLNGYMQTTARH